MGGGTLMDNIRELYIDLMKRTLTDMVYENSKKLRRKRAIGKDWPKRAFTMIGLKRLDNIQDAVEDVLQKDVPGDLVETGVWRGGATIFMKALLKAYGDTSRVVWVVDSFEGLPTPDLNKYPADRGHTLHLHLTLAVSMASVRDNFKRVRLLDKNVRFLKGWFKDTLPKSPIKRIAVLRLDGDYYESTMDVLTNLYDKVSPGGWILVDDYTSIKSCRKAVDDFREEKGIVEPMWSVDWSGVYWIKK
jgi:hypothetical protein